MVVVSILSVLILLVIAILILGGREQRKENRKIEKEKKEAVKMAKEEIKHKKKMTKKSQEQYVDILNNLKEDDELFEGDNEIEKILDETYDDYNNDAEGYRLTEEIEIKEDSDEDIQFLFPDDIEESENEYQLEKHIQEAQENDIGYLNGDEPEEEEKNSETNIETETTKKKEDK